MGVVNRGDVVVQDMSSSSSSLSLGIPPSNSFESLSTIATTQPDVQMLRNAIYGLRGAENRETAPLVPSKLPGRRKMRRLANMEALFSLCDELEEDIVIPHHSAFGQVLENSECQKVWDEFVDMEEEDQSKILSPFESSSAMTSDESSNQLRASDAFSHISSPIKSKLKKLGNIDDIQSLETDVTTFFKITPNTPYELFDQTRAQCVLLQAIAQFYNLTFTRTKNTDGIDIKITNPHDGPHPVYEETLSSFVFKSFILKID